MGRENGAYLLQDGGSAEHANHGMVRETFRAFIDKQASIQEIFFESTRLGEELKIGVAGSTERGAFRQEWRMTRR